MISRKIICSLLSLQHCKTSKKRKMQKNVALLFCFWLLIGCGTNSSNAKKKLPTPLKVIDLSESIKIAEAFVVKQGYTNRATHITMEEAQLEEGEFASNIENLMKLRKGMLKEKASKARQFAKKSKWAVGFEYNIPNDGEENQCRFVVMDTLGQGIYMSSTNTFLDWFDEEPE